MNKCVSVLAKGIVKLVLTNIMWSLPLSRLKKTHKPFFTRLTLQLTLSQAVLASLHKGIKAKQLEARLCASCLANSSDVTFKGTGYEFDRLMIKGQRVSVK